jgi:hypothetical protein
MQPLRGEGLAELTFKAVAAGVLLGSSSVPPTPTSACAWA